MATDVLQAVRYAGRELSGVDLKIAERAVHMGASQLFAGLSVFECNQIAERARTRIFARHELLFMQGQPFRQLIFIESGYVKLTRLSSNGSEVILELRGSHHAVDLPAGAAVCNHTCTARAVVPCRSMTWDWARVEHLMLTVPQFSRNVCSVLSTQLNDMQERYHEIAAEKVGRRLASALIRLTKQFGTPTEGGTELSISRQELAQLTGTTLFTVSRLISRWGELGLVLPRREAVLMLDAVKLDLISEMDN